MLRRAIPALAMLILVGGAVGIFLHKKPLSIPPVVKPVIATQPTSRPTTRRAVQRTYPTYLELVRKENTAVAATQPLDMPLELADAAHLVIHDPVYLDPVGNLWITSPDGAPVAKDLASPADAEEHIIKERPVFVQWLADDRGGWNAEIVIRATAGGFDIISKKQRRHLADDRPFKWSSAFSVLGKIVVTTDVGVDVFDVEPKVIEHYHALPGCRPSSNPPATLLDTRGILAWAPWETGKPGSNGVSRFVDGDWHDLPATEWPARPVQLSILLDGSVLRLAAGMPITKPGDVADAFPDQMHLSIGELDPPQLNESHINDLVTQLGDPDPDQRQAAFDELSRYGPALSLKLEKLIDDQLPAVRLRLRQLLRTKLAATLAGMTPVDERLEVVRRCPDGTVIFFAPTGVEIPTEHDEPDIINPAWLAMRGDGRVDHPLSNALVRDQKPDACTLRSVHDEWLVVDEAGPRRLVGNIFEPLLQRSEKRFTDIVGIDALHRWIFHDPGGDTLVIDPLIADPTPRLPAWVIAVDKGVAGWDAADFPAVSRGDDNRNWELREDGWVALNAGEKLRTQIESATQSATWPTTQVTTQPAITASAGTALLATKDGTKYFNGKDALVMVKSSGEKLTWPLPAAAIGSADPTLMQTGEGPLFLFNQPGRLLRIRPTPGEAEPFKLEAVFTRDIPNADHNARVWLDPAGRIDFVSDDNVLTVTFPAGHVPKEISRMMLQPAR